MRAWHCILALTLATALASAATLTWDGDDGDGLASTAANWDPDATPTTGDDIVIEGNPDDDITWDLTNVVVGSWDQQSGYSGTVTFETRYPAAGSFTLFSITGPCTVSAGAWTHDDNAAAEVGRLAVSVGGNFTLESAAAINVDALGYDGLQGPGTPTASHDGAGHGGTGGDDGDDGLGMGPTYGSYLAPTNLGSGGHENQTVNSGGGSVELSVSGTATIDGVISADGVSSPTDTGGAAGGSIYITAGQLAGSGVLRARGAAGQATFGAGGGGRIAVKLTDGGADFSSFSGVFTAVGGDNTKTYEDGAAGTVYLQEGDDADGQGTLRISNSNLSCSADATTAIPAGQAWTIYDLELADRGVLDVPAGAGLVLENDAIVSDADDNGDGIRLHGGTFALTPSTLTVSNWTLTANGPYGYAADTLIANGGRLAHSDNRGASPVHRLDLSVTGRVTVASNAAIFADGFGYDAQSGPGSTPTLYDGAGHGGIGGDDGNDLAGMGPVYGAYMAPTDFGSGGVEASATNSGGGVIRLTITGALTNDGLVTANGVSSASAAGGASGGSVYITAATIAGQGTIRAAGAAGQNNFGAGAGGRVAIVLTDPAADFSAYTGAVHAVGGDATVANEDGAAGTVYLEAGTELAGEGTLIVANGNLSCSLETTTAIPTGETWTVYQLELNDNGVLAAPSGSVLAVAADAIASDADGNLDGIRLHGGGFTVAPPTLTISNWSLIVDQPYAYTAETFVASGGRITHSDNRTNRVFSLHLAIDGGVTVHSNGSIVVDGLGFDAMSGPGAPTVNYDGGGHGGIGGDDGVDRAGMGITYGSYIAPTNLGSGGRELATGNSGGGAIRIVATGALTNNGVISADGLAGPTASGAAAGGSVYLTVADLAGDSNGVIRADGADGESSFGGGGGGRVAIVLTDPAADFSGYAGTVAARGGDSAVFREDGAAGTVYLQAGADADGEGMLVVNNTNRSCGAEVTTAIPSGTTWTVFNAYVADQGVLGVHAGATLVLATNRIGTDADENDDGLRLAGGSLVVSNEPLVIENWSLIADGANIYTADTVVAAGGRISHSDNETVAEYRMELTIDGSLTVQSNGAVDVVGLGYNRFEGPGKPTATFDGAGHGGAGGDNGVNGTGFGHTYGSYRAPTTLGSGGRELSNPNDGGGAIGLTVTGVLTNDGAIAADALSNPAAAGASAGGSVNLRLGSLVGGGSIRADGVSGQNGFGAGGGGRVAIALTDPGATFGVYTGTITAYGGDSTAANEDGAAGTVYLETEAQAGGRGVLRIQNPAGRATAPTVFTEFPPFTNGIPGELEKTTVQLVSNATLGVIATTNIVGDILVLTNTSVVLSNNFLWVDTREHNLEDLNDTSPGATNRADHYDQIIWLGLPPGTVILLQ